MSSLYISRRFIPSLTKPARARLCAPFQNTLLLYAERMSVSLSTPTRVDCPVLFRQWILSYLRHPGSCFSIRHKRKRPAVNQRNAFISLTISQGSVMAVVGFPPPRPRFNSRWNLWRTKWGHVFSEHVGSPSESRPNNGSNFINQPHADSVLV
jgi:hypothetical protein